MKKKSGSAKKAAKKTPAKKKATPAKKAASKKTAAKKATPKKATPKKATFDMEASGDAGFREADAGASFRPVCVTQGIRLDERCMTREEAFEIAQRHRRQTRHSVDVESC